MTDSFPDLPYGAGPPERPRRGPGPRITWKAVLGLPLLPFRWLFGGSRRGSARLEQEVLRLRREVESLRRINGELQAGKERAEVNDQRKSEFLARVTHDLRTPLNAIVGFADLIRQQPYGELGDPKYAEYITDIRATSARMLDLVRDLLDVAKVEAGQLSMRESWIRLPNILEDCRRLVAGEAADAGIQVAVEVPPGNLPGVYCDPGRVRQIITNLLTNSVKFTPKGGRITMTVVPDPVGGVVLTVADTGIGIPQDALAHVFEPYTQVRAPALVRGQQGYGLGLSLVRILADLHQAGLGIESEEGKGTIVTVTFPPTRVRRIA